MDFKNKKMESKRIEWNFKNTHGLELLKTPTRNYLMVLLC